MHALRRKTIRRLLGLLAGCLSVVTIGAVGAVSYSNTITPDGMMIHHAALPSVLRGERVDAEVLDRIHEQRGYAIFYWGRVYHVGYHFIILPDGTIQQGRPEHCRGAHAAGYNSSIGICLIGNFSTKDNPGGERGLSEPTEAQMQALTALVMRLRQSHGIPLDRVRQHRDVDPDTECPGDRFSLQRLLEE